MDERRASMTRDGQAPNDVESPRGGLSDFEATFEQRFSPYFSRRESREQAVSYVRELLSTQRRRSKKPPASGGSRGLRRLLYGARWDEDGVRDALQDFILQQARERPGIVAVGEVPFARRGNKSVGVAEQFCPSLGRTANCQVGIFLIYLSGQLATIFDRRLYLPEEWASDTRRRAAAKIPDQIMYRTKADLAFEMLRNGRDRGLPIRWVFLNLTGRAIVPLLPAIRASGGSSMIRVSGNVDGGTSPAQTPTPRVSTAEADALERAKLLKLPQTWREAAMLERHDQEWERFTLPDGRSGPNISDWAFWRVTENGSGRSTWLISSRTLSQRPDSFHFLSDAPQDTPLKTLARVAQVGSTFNQVIEEARDRAGLDRYEVRNWNSWHRHITLSMIAQAWQQNTAGR